MQLEVVSLELPVVDEELLEALLVPVGRGLQLADTGLQLPDAASVRFEAFRHLQSGVLFLLPGLALRDGELESLGAPLVHSLVAGRT